MLGAIVKQALDDLTFDKTIKRPVNKQNEVEAQQADAEAFIFTDRLQAFADYWGIDINCAFVKKKAKKSMKAKK